MLCSKISTISFWYWLNTWLSLQSILIFSFYGKRRDKAQLYSHVDHKKQTESVYFRDGLYQLLIICCLASIIDEKNYYKAEIKKFGANS